MGQYIAIGIRTELRVERKKLKLPFMTPEEVVTELERQLVPEHLYKKVETEEELVYRLRDQTAQEEFLPFLKEFYTIRYDEVGQGDRGSESYMKAISEFHNLEDWKEFAKHSYMEGFQITLNYNNILVKDWCLGFTEECIILSLTRKVLMECYGYLFRFLLNSIKLRLSQFTLKDSLSMFVTN